MRFVRLGAGRVALYACIGAVAAGCGAEVVPPARSVEKPSPSVTPSPALAPSNGQASAAGAEVRELEPTAEEQLLAAEREKQESEPKFRDVVYRMTGEGLVIELSGVRFRPSAKPVKNGKGGYEIQLSVVAEGVGDDTHTLLSPENGPLAIVATVYKKNGSKQARYVDERSGADQAYVVPGGTLTLSRKWPSGSVRGPLWWGQKVTLEVGLWGFGTGDEEVRPLKKLFVVDMVGGAKPVAVISPPEV